MRIDVEIPSLSKQKPTTIKNSYIELEETYLRYVMEFFAEEPLDEEDLMLGSKENFNLFEVIAFKHKISGLEMSNSTDLTGEFDRFRIIIPVDGFGQDLKLYFMKRKRCQEVHDIIKNWLLK